MATVTVTFGEELRRWRDHRGVSQLDLSIRAGVSQRHLSFLENGRSKPSREMVVHLGIELGLSLRDRNTLLVTAGFAPIYGEHDLDAPELDQVRHVLESLLEAYDPFPAYVIDRGWNIVLANPSAANLLTAAMHPDAPEEVTSNAALAVFHPLGLRDHIANWPEVATSLLHRLDRELLHSPGDDAINSVMQLVRSQPGVDELADRPVLPSGSDLLIPIHVRLSELDLRFFTTIATIGAAYDVTLEELRLETLLPADPDTEAFLRTMSAV